MIRSKAWVEEGDYNDSLCTIDETVGSRPTRCASCRPPCRHRPGQSMQVTNIAQSQIHLHVREQLPTQAPTICTCINNQYTSSVSTQIQRHAMVIVHTSSILCILSLSRTLSILLDGPNHMLKQNSKLSLRIGIH